MRIKMNLAVICFVVLSEVFESMEKCMIIELKIESWQRVEHSFPESSINCFRILKQFKADSGNECALNDRFHQSQFYSCQFNAIPFLSRLNKKYCSFCYQLKYVGNGRATIQYNVRLVKLCAIQSKKIIFSDLMMGQMIIDQVHAAYGVIWIERKNQSGLDVYISWCRKYR